jgi:23S rRNA (uracil1939-C5)-methyltransferase
LTVERTVTLEVGSLGEDGDGAASTPGVDTTIHVEGALPGEMVTARLSPDGKRAMLETVLRASPDRRVPVCRLADTCGGCTLQHQDQAANLAWKDDRVRRALELAGFEQPPMAVPLQVALGTRRRMELAIVRARDGAIVLGLHRRASQDVIDMTECHVLEPALVALLPALRACLRSLRALGRSGSVLINRLDGGADLLLRTDRSPDTADRTRLAEFAAGAGVCRVTWQDERAGQRSAPETMAQLTPARALIGGRLVDVPSGAFLQATDAAEAAIVAAVLAGLPSPMPPKPRIVELYAGCGTLTLPLASVARTQAYEGEAGAVAALAKAAGGMRVEAHKRDLARNPLAISEMRDASAIVLDPPHGGAGRQMEMVAGAGAGTVIIVSCNPAALRREAAMLRVAGYALAAARTIDQFLFSPRIESVSVFRRGSSRRSRSGPSR